jgi:alcohol dehydrogenase
VTLGSETGLTVRKFLNKQLNILWEGNMRVAYLSAGTGGLQSDEVPTSEIGPDDALVAIDCCFVAPFLRALCPPDTSFVTPVRPFSPGTDAIGTVVSVGPRVGTVAPGDVVYVDTFLDAGWDGHNGEAAFAGNFAVSSRADRLLDQFRNGTFASHISIPARSLTPVAPAMVKARAHALCRLGWLSTAHHALERGGMQPSANVAVLGASGHLGSSAVLMALALGAERVSCVARSKDRMHPLAALNPRVEIVPAVPTGCDLVISAAEGTSATMIEQALAALRRGGNLVLTASPDVPPRAAGLVLREVSVIGSFWFPPETPGRLVALVANGTLDLGPLRSHVYKLGLINQALARAAALPALEQVVVEP